MKAATGPFLTAEDKAKGAIVAALVLAIAAWISIGGYRFSWDGMPRLLIILPILFLLAEFYRRFRPDPTFVVLTKETAWLLAFCAAAAIFSNLVVTLNLPSVDSQLAAADGFFGFHWPDWYDYFTGRYWLGLVAAVLYVGALPMLAFAVIGVCLLGRPDRARELVLAAMIGGLIAIAISAVLPAAGAIGWFWPDATGRAHLPIVDRSYEQTFYDLRAGLVTEFSLNGVKGLITFPSYHATLSTIVIIAFRRLRFFWPVLLINVGIILTTPIEGGHHLVDAMAGVVVAIVSVAVAAAWRRRLAMRDAREPWLSRPAPQAVPGETA